MSDTSAHRDALPAVAAIGDYALLGDTRGAALASSAGAIDWMCVPRFDSPPLMSRLVGGPEGGAYVVRPTDAAAQMRDRRYRPGSTIVETTWVAPAGTITLHEGFVARVDADLLPTTLLVREVHVQRAPASIDVCFDPRFGWERKPPRTRAEGGALVCTWGTFATALTASTSPLRPGVVERITVEPGRPLVLAMSVADREPLTFVAPERASAALDETDTRWRAWSASLADLGPFHDAVLRSLITLRLLTYAPSGAPVAAPTTSLPELPGGERNWDYRYAWPRDASLGIAAFLDAGSAPEAEAFMYWLLHAGRRHRPRIPVLLDLDGRRAPDEHVLDDWPGYRDSRPVRVGNEAATQHQLDVYGWVLDAGARLEAAGHRLFTETWRVLAEHSDFVATHWSEPDSGIWEVRDTPRHYVHSKVMAWVALDRAIALARTHRARPKVVRRWHEARDAIRSQVDTLGFDTDRGCYTRAFDDSGLDAAAALVGVVGFDPPDAPRVLRTLDAIKSGLGAAGDLVYRYQPGTDGLEGGEAAFLPCSFWFAHALARAGRVDAAVEMLESLVARGGRLGLFPEEVDPSSGEALGNYPQALSHSSFVRAALAVRPKHGVPGHGASSSPSAAP